MKYIKLRNAGFTRALRWFWINGMLRYPEEATLAVPTLRRYASVVKLA